MQVTDTKKEKSDRRSTHINAVYVEQGDSTHPSFSYNIIQTNS